MEQNARLHPLLTIAAISVSVFSLVGIGAVTGLLPQSTANKSEIQAAAPAAAVEQFSAVTPPLPVAPAPLSAAPEVKPAPKKVVRHAPAAPKPAPVVLAEAPGVMAPPPPPPPAPIAVAPKPICADCGVVENFREVATKGQGTGLGAVAGGIAGALLGHQFGHGSGKTVITVAGAAGGAYAGNQVEKNVRSGKHYEISVRMEDGSVRTVAQDAAPAWRVGERVRIINNQVVANS